MKQPTSTGHRNPKSGRYVPDNGATPIFLSKGERFPPANKQAANYRRRKEGMGPIAIVASLVGGIAMGKAQELAETTARKAWESPQGRRARRSLYVARKEWDKGT